MVEPEFVLDREKSLFSVLFGSEEKRSAFKKMMMWGDKDDNACPRRYKGFCRCPRCLQNMTAGQEQFPRILQGKSDFTLSQTLHCSMGLRNRHARCTCLQYFVRFWDNAAVVQHGAKFDEETRLSILAVCKHTFEDLLAFALEEVGKVTLCSFSSMHVLSPHYPNVYAKVVGFTASGYMMQATVELQLIYDNIHVMDFLVKLDVETMPFKWAEQISSYDCKMAWTLNTCQEGLLLPDDWRSMTSLLSVLEDLSQRKKKQQQKKQQHALLLLNQAEILYTIAMRMVSSSFAATGSKDLLATHAFFCNRAKLHEEYSKFDTKSILLWNK